MTTTRDLLSADALALPALTILRDRFVFVPHSGLFFGVSAEGAWILKSMMSGQSSTETIADLIRTFGVNRGTALRDLDQFHQRLLQLGLLQAGAGADH